MAETTFSSSRLKIDGAREHIRRLNSAIDAFNKTDFCKIHIEKNPVTQRQFVKIDSIGTPPKEIPIIVGEFAHNIKGALDHIAYQIAPGEQRYFPKGTKREDVVASADLKSIEAASKEVAKFILDDVQPFKGGRCGIWELTGDNNLDKHRELVPTLTLTGLQNVMMMDSNNNLQLWGLITLQPGTNLSIPPLGGDLQIYRSGKPTAAPFFSKGSTFAGKAIIPTLNNIVEDISGVIDSLEALWFGQVRKSDANKSG